MTRAEIIDEIELIQAIVLITDNVLVRNKLERIKQALMQEWDESDAYWRYVITTNNI